MAKKLPFKVSARTARLIGRENVATPEGALIELVKNAYDADADNCIVIFDNRYTEIAETLASKEYKEVIELVSKIETAENKNSKPENGSEEAQSQKKTYSEIIIAAYKEDLIGGYKLMIEDTSSPEYEELKLVFQKTGKLWIIDDGDGMTGKVIENQWMLIGTENKDINAKTERGRIKTGAKGIGRFALDKLGDSCEMFTTPKKPNQNQGYKWSVEWSAFEAKEQDIHNITASLEEKNASELKSIAEYPSHFDTFPRDFLEREENKGTVLQINSLRDIWNERKLTKLFSNMESLVPPEEQGGFNLFVFAWNKPSSYGKVEPASCRDFDYKVSIKFDTNGMGTFKLINNEFDFKKFPKGLFSRKEMKKFPFDSVSLSNGEFEKKLHISELVPGFKDIDKENALTQIGQFQFDFYHLKLELTKENKAKFRYKGIKSKERKEWMNKFGGIKIYRDDFRVRPYGEPKSNSFDWLSLGHRKQQSPASISKSNKSWRAAPQNVVGTIKISRIHNKIFADKSNREGLLETETFEVFKSVIIGSIHEFEKYRNRIAVELRAYDAENDEREKIREKAAKVASEIVKNKGKSKSDLVEQPPAPSTENIEVLAEEITYQQEEIEELQSEQKLLRGMATIGTVISSLTHELHGLRDTMVSRINELEELFSSTAPREDYFDTPEAFNPYVLLDDMKEQDEKIKKWLGFSLSSVRADKRKRRQIFLHEYMERFEKTWSGVLKSRQVNLSYSFKEECDPSIKAFEIEIDSIFNNLLINSLDAFQRRGAPPKRDILISFEDTPIGFAVTYSDSGPGLSKDIKNPEQIFECFFTTKRDQVTGEETGTGIGMWMLYNVVLDEYGGEVTILDIEKEGFSLEMAFPVGNTKK